MRDVGKDGVAVKDGGVREAAFRYEAKRITPKDQNEPKSLGFLHLGGPRGGQRKVVNARMPIAPRRRPRQTSPARVRAFNRVARDGVSLGDVGCRADDPMSRPAD